MSIVTIPLTSQLANGTTADATQVMADLNQIATNVNANAAANGSNSDITSLNSITAITSAVVINNAGAITSTGTVTGAGIGAGASGLASSGGMTVSAGGASITGDTVINAPGVGAVNPVVINNTTGTQMLGMSNNGTFTGSLQSSTTQTLAVVNAASSLQLLTVANATGNVAAAGTIQAGSDKRWKKDIEQITPDSAGAFVKSLAKLASTYLIHGTESAGFIAQRLRKVKFFGKRFTSKDEQGFWHVDYMGMQAPMAVALADALKRIEALEKQLG
jgi:hypothetical protein